MTTASLKADQGPESSPTPTSGPLRSVRILGVRVDDVTYDETVARVEGFIADGGPHLITTPNPEIVMVARQDRAFRAALDRASINIPDGIGLLIVARLRGSRIREHVRGTDLVERLAARGAERGHRWYLLGAEPGIARDAASRLMDRHPGLRIVGAEPGSPLPADDDATREMIAVAGPVDLILVAYGAPRQELWLDRNLGPLRIPVGIGVGGVFNFLAGRAPRAPRWIRRLELEWLHRLFTQPWRWRRQLALPKFLALAALDAVRRKRVSRL